MWFAPLIYLTYLILMIKPRKNTEYDKESRNAWRHVRKIDQSVVRCGEREKEKGESLSCLRHGACDLNHVSFVSRGLIVRAMRCLKTGNNRHSYARTPSTSVTDACWLSRHSSLADLTSENSYQKMSNKKMHSIQPVSYTHLTLPTKRIV